MAAALGRRWSWGLLLLPLVPPLAAAAPPAAPSVKQALALMPVQKDVEIDQPADEELARCTIKPEKIGGRTGWVVRDAAGQALRSFVDTNGDNVVDQWSYFQHGIETYRDIDSNFNNKADQYRWLGTSGTRWGLDKNEDGRIDSWRVISAEELTAEVVAALRDRDAQRFGRLLLTRAELKALGLGREKEAELDQKVAQAAAGFAALADSQTLVTPQTKWVYFGGSRPSIVPQGTAGSTADLTVYENVAAMIDTSGQHGQIPVGALVKVQDAWRLVDLPLLSAEAANAEPQGVFLVGSIRRERPTVGDNRPNEEVQKRMAELEKLDQEAASAPPDQQADLNHRRVQILRSLADAAPAPQDRQQWLRQLIDTVSAAAQNGTFPDGPKVLSTLARELKSKNSDPDLLAHAEFSLLTIDYYRDLQQPEADYAKIQERWLGQLQKFIDANPQAPDAADAMLQLGIAEEFAGQEEKALAWYSRIVKNHDGTAPARKAQGAKTRLESVGKRLQLAGQALDGATVDLNSPQYQGKVVLLHYWASTAQPSTADLPILKDLLDRYGKKGLEIIGVNLDLRRSDLDEFLVDNPLRWTQVHEAGGIDGRLPAELGIHTLPTMILLDKQGRVARRSIAAAELEKELKTLLK